VPVTLFSIESNALDFTVPTALIASPSAAHITATTTPAVTRAPVMLHSWTRDRYANCLDVLERYLVNIVV
jgi:hypothetical protein